MQGDSSLPDVLMRYLMPLFAAVTLATATACSNTDATSPNGSVVGNWSLRTLNGSTLPYTVNGSTALTGEQLYLNSDGSYSDIASYSNGTTFTEVGYYSVNNNLITFQDQTDNLTYTGSISGNVLTENGGSFTSVYQKN
jgi:hypothetical protein